MSSVFLGGSRKLSRLNSQLRMRIRSLMTSQHTVLVGDANGIDKAVQSFLAAEGYRNVIVHCMDGVCRNNIGNWPLVSISGKATKKDFAYFAVKDAEMSRTADFGFMIWDGKSKGTLNNVLNLIQQEKSVLVYFSPRQQFFPVKSKAEVEEIVGHCDAESKAILERVIQLSKRADSKQGALNLA
jgi:hypothetical protein